MNAKARIRELDDEHARADRARLRFESRNERLEQEKTKRDQELREQKDAALKAGRSAIEDILKRKKQDEGDDEN